MVVNVVYNCESLQLAFFFSIFDQQCCSISRKFSFIMKSESVFFSIKFMFREMNNAHNENRVCGDFMNLQQGF